MPNDDVAYDKHILFFKETKKIKRKKKQKKKEDKT